MHHLYKNKKSTTKGHLNRRPDQIKNILYSWIGRLSIINMSVTSKLIYKSNLIQINVTVKSFNLERDKLILNLFVKIHKQEQLGKIQKRRKMRRDSVLCK